MMRLIGQNVLAKAVREHPDARKWLQAWALTVQDATWRHLNDVRRDYPSADGIKLKSEVVVTVFNVKGNEYRLLTSISYPIHTVLVLEVLSHAEYDKSNWKRRYQPMSAATTKTLTNRQPVPDTYLDLIQEFPLRRIRSLTDHAQATRLVLRLASDSLDQGTADYLDVLVGLIADYERRADHDIDTSQVSTSELVRHRMDERGLSVSELARLTGVPQSNLSDMLHGKRSWSKNAIRALSSHLNIRADRFLT